METSLKVRRKRRGHSLYKKIFEYEELFNMRIAIIAQEKTSGDYEIFQPVQAEDWPPAMKDINPKILHTGQPPKLQRHAKLGKIEKLLRQRKVPKPPMYQDPRTEDLGAGRLGEIQDLCI